MSGSSVPEAARDAARAAFHRVLSTQQGTTYGAIDAALEAAALHIVAAAVAEERATTGRRIDAVWIADLLASHEGDEGRLSQEVNAARLAADHWAHTNEDAGFVASILSQVSCLLGELEDRAALASPGEET